MSLEEVLISVWRQTLVEEVEAVELNGWRFPVRRTPRKHLRQVDFNVNGEAVRGIEQNRETSSRWARLAREGRRVMQFLSKGRYIANVVDGKIMFYKQMAA